MSAQLVAELVDLRRVSGRCGSNAGEPMPELVFASETGGFLDETNIRYVYGRILTAAGLRHLKFHYVSEGVDCFPPRVA